MPIIRCPITDCEYATEDVEAAVAVALLVIHNNVHTSTPPTVAATNNKQRAPKIERPRISAGSSEETWNAFITRWGMFTRGTMLSADERVQHLFQCCEEELGDTILQGHPAAVSGTEEGLLAVMKQLAVVPVAVSVRRTELLATKQDHGENARAFFARIKGKAATCSYSVKCSSGTCPQVIDFTDIMVKDVLIAGLVDEEIRKELLGWTELDTKTVEETVSFIEAKEMARDAMTKSPVAAAVSTYKATNRNAARLKTKAFCADCNAQMEKFAWNQRKGRMVECSLCLPCWRKANPRKGKNAKDKQKNDVAGSKGDETSALLIGAVTQASCEEPDFMVKNRFPLYDVNVPPRNSAADSTELHLPVESAAVDAVRVKRAQSNPKAIVLDHHIFDSDGRWQKSESMAHPTLRLQLTTEAADYERVGAVQPKVMPSFVTVVTDTGAQSCLWSLHDFYGCGFKDSDLIPVKRTMLAANREEIKICGAIFVRLSGVDNEGAKHTAPIMAYVSPNTQKFYLSREALIQLRVIPKNFPQVGAAMETSAVENPSAECSCPLRTLPPGRPTKLPFPCHSENNQKMKKWLIESYAPSTFNKCPHQLLEGITGPALQIHLAPDAPLGVVHTPAMVPLHWQDEVKRQIDADVALGVLEKVPHGEPSVCCHRMVVARKADGGPRRTIDMSSLNDFCLRETHHVKPPFQQARAIPPNTWKSVTDAWNGYHSVPLREQDRHLTTFITPWGRFRYRVAPQGSAASGDGYARRYDEVIADVERKTKCVDDTAQWDEDLEAHWWRMIDFLELMGRNGIILNSDKFQFAQREINFAGFRITETGVKPLEKYLRAIADFPTPKRTTDIRSWFGLVHQVSHYNQLTELLTPFKPFLSPRMKFLWNEELNAAFEKSKTGIINAIKEGVEIFDLDKPTCLRTDYSAIGIGYFLSQKHCECSDSSPGCCENGWRITLAGSRFLRPAETRYATIEGEALAIAWSLEQTKYFTQGCDNLKIITDHIPLVKLFGDTSLDQITNSRLFSLKQRTMPWKFTIEYKPGKDNSFSDAASRFPTYSDDGDSAVAVVADTEVLCGLMVDDLEETEDVKVIAALSQADKQFRAITWDMVREETSKDEQMQNLIALINSVFPQEKSEMPHDLVPYWSLRNSLYIVDGVVLMKDQVMIPPALRSEVAQSYVPGSGVRIVIPPALRKEVIFSLHSAHQGVSSMNERAKASVYWPGITADILNIRNGCQGCNKIMPSQARLPPIEPWIPTTPFEAIACDFFHYKGYYYFVAADRLSGWLEVQQVRVGTNEAGAQGLCMAFRRLMVTFGVPIEISSDGGPEFIAAETKAFFRRWGMRHRLSSVSFPSSNGRAELAVKTAKRLIMDNVGPSGKLDNDGMVRALLTYRNTPDPGCKLSPAQILLGRQLRDSLPYITKALMIFNNPEINVQWREAWRAKEDALRARYVKTIENLSDHSRMLPPLRHGDHVMVQNQRGRFPKKWDNSGVVVETKSNDQYVVKVAGSGRLTLRNRRFLRKYGPHFKQGPEWQFSSPADRFNGDQAAAPDDVRQMQVCKAPLRTTNSSDIVSPQTPCRGNDSSTDSSDEVPAGPLQETPLPSLIESRDNSAATPQRLSFGDIPNSSTHGNDDPVLPSPHTPPVVFTQSTRPVRITRPRTVYDASTGTYTKPSPVPDNI